MPGVERASLANRPRAPHAGCTLVRTRARTLHRLQRPGVCAMFRGAMYMHRYGAVLLSLAIAGTGCENKSKPKDTAGTPGSEAAAKPAGDDLKAEPVGKDPAAALPAQPRP